MLRSTQGAVRGSTFTLAFAAILVRGATHIRRLIRNRIAVARLGELDERGLKDIGLTPSDVRAALSLPLSVDPSMHLCEVAGHKRSVAQERPGEAASIARLRARDADVTTRGAVACSA